MYMGCTAPKEGASRPPHPLIAPTATPTMSGEGSGPSQPVVRWPAIAPPAIQLWGGACAPPRPTSVLDQLPRGEGLPTTSPDALAKAITMLQGSDVAWL